MSILWGRLTEQAFNIFVITLLPEHSIPAPAVASRSGDSTKCRYASTSAYTSLALWWVRSKPTQTVSIAKLGRFVIDNIGPNSLYVVFCKTAMTTHVCRCPSVVLPYHLERRQHVVLSAAVLGNELALA